MNDKLYIKFKLALLKFDFDKPSSFTELYKHSKSYNPGKPFKQFVKICKNMGVYSKVVRLDDRLQRVLVYDKTMDKYIKGEVKILEPCPTCKGAGVTGVAVEVPNI